jgi:PAS domain S-box-containing protein
MSDSVSRFRGWLTGHLGVWLPPLLYALFSLLWILFTDDLVARWYPSSKDAEFYQSMKGTLFVLVTAAGLLYALIRLTRRIERRQAELLVTSTALEHSANAVTIADAQGRILWVNPAFTQLTGYTLDELPRDTPSEFLSPVLASTPQDPTGRDSLDPTSRWQGQAIGHRKDGTSYVSARTITRIVDADGHHRYVGIEQDLTAIHAAQIALRESEAKYRSLFENMGDGLILVTADGKIFDANDQACALFGLPRETLLGQRPAQLSPVYQPDGRPSVPAAEVLRATAQRSHRTQRFEWRHQQADGTPFDVEITLDPLILHGSTVLQATLRDITQRKQAATLLQESERRFRELADLLPQPVWELNTEGYLTFSNQCGLDLFGYTQADLDAGLSALDTVAPADRAAARTALTHWLTDPSPTGHAQEYTALRRDGTTFPAIFHGAPIRHDGQLVGMRGITIDITQQKAAADAFRKQAEQLAAARTVTTEITRELNLGTLLHLILSRASDLLDVKAGAIFLWEPDTQELVLASATGNENASPRLQPGQGVAGQVVQTRTGLSTNRYRDEPYVLPGILANNDLTAAIAEPLLYHDTLVGALVLNNQWTPDRRFTEDDQTLLRLFAQQAAISIANARLYQASTSAAERLQALLLASHAVMAGLDLAITLSQIVDTVRQFLRPDHLTLYLVDPDTHVLRADYPGMIPPGYLPIIPFGKGITWEVVQSNQPLFLQDLLHDARNLTPELDQAAGYRTYLGLPIHAGTTVLGVLGFKSRAVRTYTADELAYYTSFADQAAIALENARLFEAERRRRTQLNTVRTLTAEITRELDLSKLLRLILQRALDLLQGGGGAIALWSADEQVLLTQVWERQPDWIGQMRFRLGEGMIGTVAQERKGLLVQDYRSSPYAHPTIVSDLNTTAAIAEPLLYRDELIGVILLNNLNRTDRIFTAEDHHLLALFAGQASIAIQNARLFAMTQDRLRQWQEAVRAEQAQTAFTQAILASLAAHVAVIDQTGNILEVNEAWRHFAQNNRAPEALRAGRGQNYLTTLRHPAALEDRTARTALAGIEALLAGTRDRFELEYNCNSPEEERWFLLQATRLTGTQGGAVLAHVNITERKQAEERVGALLRSAEALLGGADRPAALDQIVTEAGRLIHSNQANLLLIDPEYKMLRLAAHWGLEDPEFTDLPLTGSLSGQVALTSLPRFEPNVPEAPDNPRAAFDRAHGLQTYLGLPVVLDKTVIGVLTFKTRDQREYTQWDYEALTTFAHQAAVAIQQARLLTMERTRRRQVEAVRALANEITRELDLTRLMDRTVESASRLLEAPGSILYRWHPDTRQLRPEALYGYPPEATTDLVLSEGEGVVGTVAQTRQGLHVNHYQHSDWALPQSAARYTPSAVAAEPLLYRQELLGVLAVTHHAPGEHFTPAHTTILGLFAYQAAIAIANARLHTATQRKVDQLAALYRLSGSLTAAPDPQHVADAVCEAATTALPTTVAQVWEWPDPTGPLALRSTSIPVEANLKTHTLQPGQGLAGLAVDRQVPILATDIRTDPRWRNAAWAEAEHLQAAAAIPLVHGSRCWGALVVCTTTPHQFAEDDEDIRLLQMVANHAAAAFEKAHLFQSEQERAAQLETLLHTTHALLGGGDLSETLGYLLQMASEITRTPNVKLFLIHPHSQTLHLEACQGPRGVQQPTRLGEGLSGLVAETRRPLYVPDMREDPRNPFQADDIRLGHVSYLGLPICYKDKILGVLSFDCPTRRVFSPAEMEYLTAFADHAAVAIRQAQLLAAATQTSAQLKALQAVTEEITRELDLDPLLRTITDRASRLFVGGCGAVWLWDPAADALVVHNWTLAGAWMQGRRLRLGEGIAGVAAQTRQSLLTNEYRNHPQAHSQTLAHSDVTALIAVPLLYHEELLGALVVDNAGHPTHIFTAEDQELLELFGAQAAIAIHNAQATTRLKDHALRLARLGEATRSIDQLRSPEAVATQVLQAAETLYPNGGYILRRRDASAQALQLLGHRGMRAPELVPVHAAPTSLAQHAYQTAQPVSILDVQHDPHISDPGRMVTEGFLSGVTHPLLFEGTPTGTLTVYWRIRQVLSPDDTHVIAILSAHAALALKNAELYATAQQEIDERRRTEMMLRTRTDRLEAVRHVVTGMAAELDLDRLLQLITDQAAILLDTDRSTLYLWDPTTQRLTRRAATGYDVLGEPCGSLELGQGAAGTAARTREGIRINEYETSAVAIPLSAQEVGLRGVMAEPLLARGELLGVLSVSTLRSRRFTTDDQQLLELLATQAAIAIRNARLFDERLQAQTGVEARTHQLETVRRVTEEITRVLDLDQLLALILVRVNELVPARAIVIRLWDPATQTLIPKASIGTPPGERPGLTLALNEGVVGTAAATRTGLFENDFPASRFARPRVTLISAHTRVLAEPLLFHDELVGVLGLTRLATQAPFTDSDQAILQLFAAQIAIAIMNAHDRTQLAANERRLSGLLETAAEGILSTDRYQQITFANPTMAALLDHDSPEALIGQSYLALVAPDEQAAAAESWEARQRGESMHRERTLLTRGGRRRLFWVNASAVRAEDGTFQGALGMFTDITDRKQTETAIRTVHAITEDISEHLNLAELLHAIAAHTCEALRATSCTVWRLDPKTQELHQAAWAGEDRALQADIVHMGHGLTGATALTQHGICVPDLAASDYAATGNLSAFPHRAVLAEPLVHGQTLFGVLTVRRTTPGACFEEADRHLVQLLSRQLAVAIHNATLFTELDESYEQLRQTMTGLVATEKLRALGQMAAGIAHELNNTLQGILSGIQKLQHHQNVDDTPPSPEDLADLERATRTGGQTVRNLLDFAKQQPLSPPEPLPLGPILQHVLRTSHGTARDRIQIHTEIAPTLPPILGVSSKLSEVFLNLVINACDAMPEGGQLWIKAAAEPDPSGGPGDVVVTIRDSGCGMTPEVLQRVFEPFFTTKGAKGSGLGMAMVFGTVEQHKGRIKIESAPAQGTTVRVTLPATTLPIPRVTPQPGPPAQGPRLRLLLVEDEADVRRFVGEMLETHGHTVLRTGDPDQVLSLLTQHPIDLVITDYFMPTDNGVELARRIKAAYPDLPIFLLTGLVDEAAEAAQADGIITQVVEKPLDVRELERHLAPFQPRSHPLVRP